ncbi:hypothetical protein PS15m_001291 [Mucor circinelloides]
MISSNEALGFIFYMLLDMKISIRTLLILFVCHCIGVYAADKDFGVIGHKACLSEGEACGIGVNGFRGARCCAGSYCVSEVCKVLTPIAESPAKSKPPGGNEKQSPSHPDVGAGSSNLKTPFDTPQVQQCNQKLKNAGCGHDKVNALGLYCVCGCPDVVNTSEQMAANCIPTMQDRIKLIKVCREYKSIRDCPQFKNQLTASSACAALKDQFTKQCKACGSRCTSLVERSFEK